MAGLLDQLFSAGLLDTRNLKIPSPFDVGQRLGLNLPSSKQVQELPGNIANVGRRLGLNLPTSKQTGGLLMATPHFIGPGADAEQLVYDSSQIWPNLKKGNYLQAAGHSLLLPASLAMMAFPGTIAPVRKAMNLGKVNRQEKIQKLREEATAQRADKDILQMAKGMEKAGANRDEIWEATAQAGQPWRKDVDGKWKFEVDDSGVRVRSLEGAEQILRIYYGEKKLPPRHFEKLRDVIVSHMDGDSWQDAEKAMLGPARAEIEALQEALKIKRTAGRWPSKIKLDTIDGVASALKQRLGGEWDLAPGSAYKSRYVTKPNGGSLRVSDHDPMTNRSSAAEDFVTIRYGEKGVEISANHEAVMIPYRSSEMSSREGLQRIIDALEKGRGQ